MGPLSGGKVLVEKTLKRGLVNAWFVAGRKRDGESGAGGALEQALQSAEVAD